MSQDKAQSAVNGGSIRKDCNAALAHLVTSLRARREATICVVAPFVKDTPFTAGRALQLTASHHAEIYVLFDTLHWFGLLNHARRAATVKPVRLLVTSYTSVCHGRTGNAQGANKLRRQ